jgi:membrane associated rhomboid family serine protease/Zn-finger nucleic acid-binding protein
MFTCPHCAQDLQPQRGQQGVIYTCPICKGHAVAISILRRIFSPAQVNSIWDEAEKDPAPDGCDCPICRAAMHHVTWSEPARAMTLDLCLRCAFVWFDPQEYEELAPAPPKPHALGEIDMSKLSLDAREALAMQKVREIAQTSNDYGEAPDEAWKTLPAILGLPVEIDGDEPPRAPVATYALTAVISVVTFYTFFLQYSQHVDVFSILGLIPAEMGRFYGLTFVTSFFLHVSLVHLVGNLYFLVTFGRHVEGYLGSWRYLLLMAAAALVGDLTDIACTSQSMAPMIGASGGISGVLAFYAIKFPHARLSILFRYIVYFRWITIPAWVMFAIWILLQFQGAYNQLHQLDNVASLAHLGGVIAGIAFWALWRNLDTKPAAASVGPQITVN